MTSLPLAEVLDNLRKLESTMSTWTTQEISINDNQTGIDCAQTFFVTEINN
jgi:hypothetical protein